MFSKYSVLAIVALLLSGASFAADEEGGPSIAYYELKPSIVSNLSGGPKYIRTNVQFMTEQAGEIEKVKTHSPALRHHILMLIAGADGAKLTSREGKEALRVEALAVAKKTMKELTGKEILNDLYFTAYYVK